MHFFRGSITQEHLQAPFLCSVRRLRINGGQGTTLTSIEVISAVIVRFIRSAQDAGPTAFTCPNEIVSLVQSLLYRLLHPMTLAGADLWRPGPMKLETPRQIRPPFEEETFIKLKSSPPSF